MVSFFASASSRHGSNVQFERSQDGPQTFDFRYKLVALFSIQRNYNYALIYIVIIFGSFSLVLGSHRKCSYIGGGKGLDYIEKLTLCTFYYFLVANIPVCLSAFHLWRHSYKFNDTDWRKTKNWAVAE